MQRLQSLNNGAADMDPDIELLERWRSGDREAGNELFSRHFADVYRFLEHKVGVEADELTQRTFTACLAAREQFRGHASFRTYLFTIARNEFCAYLRQTSGREHVDLDETSIAEIITSLASRIDREEQGRRLRRALRELPGHQQMLLELHYWHDHDAAALGEIFSEAAGTIRVRLTRARKALRAKLAELGLQGAAPAPGDRLEAALAEPEL